MIKLYEKLLQYNDSNYSINELAKFKDEIRELLAEKHQAFFDRPLLHQIVYDRNESLIEQLVKIFHEIDFSIINDEEWSALVFAMALTTRNKSYRPMFLRLFNQVKYVPRSNSLGGTLIELELTLSIYRFEVSLLLASHSVYDVFFTDTPKILITFDLEVFCQYLAENYPVIPEFAKNGILSFWNDKNLKKDSRVDQKIFKIIERINDKNLPADESLNHLVSISYYIKKIISGDATPLSEEFKDSLSVLYSFLKENSTLALPSTRIVVVAELLTLLLFPNRLYQENFNICGAAIYVRELAEKSPLRFIILGTNLAKSGFSDIPFKIKASREIYSQPSISLAMMMAIRHSTNLYQYSAVSSLEMMEGATLPKDLEKWFKKSGFNLVRDDLTFFDKNHDEISLMHRFFLGGLYSSNRQRLASDERIKLLKTYVSQKGVGVIGSISSQFTNSLSDNSYETGLRGYFQDYEKLAEKDRDCFLGIEYGHFVTILSFEENADNSINMVLNSWGALYYLKNMPRQLFDLHCHGVFITEFKSPLTLDSEEVWEAGIKKPQNIATLGFN